MVADLAMKYELANIFKACAKLDAQMLVPFISFTNMKTWRFCILDQRKHVLIQEDSDVIRKCSDSNMKSQGYVHIALGINA